MYFDDQVSKDIVRFGVGATAGNGRHHFMASIGETNKIQQLCVSVQKDIKEVSEKPVKWFENESHAVKMLRNDKKACHKCLRSIETTDETTELSHSR